MFATVILLTILSIGEHTLEVEIADTPEARNKGLMGRTELPQDSGMLFVFDTAEPLSFWMKNTLIPLSIGFFDEKKRLIETLDMQVHSNKTQPLTTYRSSKPALYALEVPLNWFREKRIRKGVEFSFLDPPIEIE